MGPGKRYFDPLDQATIVLPWEVRNSAGPFTLAESGDGDKVANHFRNINGYLLEDNGDDAGVCIWQVTDPVRHQDRARSGRGSSGLK